MNNENFLPLKKVGAHWFNWNFARIFFGFF